MDVSEQPSTYPPPLKLHFGWNGPPSPSRAPPTHLERAPGQRSDGLRLAPDACQSSTEDRRRVASDAAPQALVSLGA